MLIKKLKDDDGHWGLSAERLSLVPLSKPHLNGASLHDHNVPWGFNEGELQFCTEHGVGADETVSSWHWVLIGERKNHSQ